MLWKIFSSLTQFRTSLTASPLRSLDSLTHVVIVLLEDEQMNWHRDENLKITTVELKVGTQNFRNIFRWHL